MKVLKKSANGPTIVLRKNGNIFMIGKKKHNAPIVILSDKTPSPFTGYRNTTKYL